MLYSIAVLVIKVTIFICLYFARTLFFVSFSYFTTIFSSSSHLFEKSVPFNVYLHCFRNGQRINLINLVSDLVSLLLLRNFMILTCLTYLPIDLKATLHTTKLLIIWEYSPNLLGRDKIPRS